MTPEQEAELAKAIEIAANKALGGNTTVAINPSKPVSEEEQIEDLIGQLDKNINNRSLMRTYK